MCICELCSHERNLLYMRTHEVRLAIAAEVRGAIVRAGSTVAGTAAGAGLSEAALLSRLSGRQAFSIDELYAISRALGCGILDLLPGRGELMP